MVKTSYVRKRFNKKRTARRTKGRKTYRSYAGRGLRGKVGVGRRLGMSPLALLSPCAQDYMEVLANPFEPNIKGAPCIPDYRSIPSSKFYLRARGTFAPMGSDGSGLAFVALNPWRPNNDSSPVAAPIYVTAKAGTVATINTSITDNTNRVHLTAVDNEVVANYFDTTLTAADWAADGSANKFRVVSAGLRISYAGTWDSMKGTVALIRHPANTRTFLVQTTKPTFEDLLKYDECGYGALNHGDHLQVYYAPIDNDDFEYQVQNNSATADAPIMVAAIKGGPADATYTYEAIVWYEAVGSTMRGETPSHVDLKGLGYAMSGNKKQALGQKPGAVKRAMVNSYFE